jgi:hypothetical protein
VLFNETGFASARVDHNAHAANRVRHAEMAAIEAIADYRSPGPELLPR